MIIALAVMERNIKNIILVADCLLNLGDEEKQIMISELTSFLLAIAQKNLQDTEYMQIDRESPLDTRSAIHNSISITFVVLIMEILQRLTRNTLLLQQRLALPSEQLSWLSHSLQTIVSCSQLVWSEDCLLSGTVRVIGSKEGHGIEPVRLSTHRCTSLACLF
ncbi:hypothetical protein ACS0TY_016169 [Phlomoides rotata]